MKYWKGKTGTIKEKQYGTMDDNGFVPDSIECSKDEYLLTHPILPVTLPIKKPIFIKLKNINTNEIIDYEVL